MKGWDNPDNIEKVPAIRPIKVESGRKLLKENERKAIVTNPFLKGWTNFNKVDKVPVIRSTTMEFGTKPFKENEKKSCRHKSLFKRMGETK